jgi:hypothetical protein
VERVIFRKWVRRLELHAPDRKGGELAVLGERLEEFLPDFQTIDNVAADWLCIRRILVEHASEAKVRGVLGRFRPFETIEVSEFAHKVNTVSYLWDSELVR